MFGPLKIKARSEDVQIFSLFMLTTFLALFFFRPSFSTNDDVEIRAILNGTRYGEPDYHIPYMNSSLAYLLSYLYKSYDTIYWYELFLTITTVLTSMIIITILSKSFARMNRSLIPPIFLTILILIFRAINSMSYTNSAIFLTGTSILLFIHANSGEITTSVKRFACYFFSYFLLILGYTTRPNISILVLVFLLPSLVFSLIKMNSRRFQLLFFLALSTTIGFFHFLNALGYRNQGWKDWKSFQDSFIWPFEYNIIADSITQMNHSSLLQTLGINENQFQLWQSANNIDPSLFSKGFLDAAQEIPISIHLEMILDHLLSFVQSYWCYLSVAVLLLARLWFIRHLNRSNNLRDDDKFSHLLSVSFQSLYGLTALFAMVTYRKDVSRVTLGIVLFLILLILMTDYPVHFTLIDEFFKMKFNDFISYVVYATCCLLLFTTILDRPAVQPKFGGHSPSIEFGSSESVASQYISELPQCKGLVQGKPKCTLFLHTNSITPFTTNDVPTINKLDLFWSAFSPEWVRTIRESGRTDSLDLLCSDRGFLLNSKKSVQIVRDYINSMRKVQILYRPVNSLSVPVEVVDSDLYLTLGTKSKGCSKL